MLSPEHSEGFLGGGYLILCGMRIGEVVNLKVSDVIDYNNPDLSLIGTGTIPR